MAGKPKPTFWIAVVLVILALIGFSLYRTGKLFTPQSGSGISKILAPLSKSSGGSGNELEIGFYSSSAKKKWINEMVAEFNAANNTAGGKVIKIKAVHGNSGDQLDALKEGKIKPELWSPGDESWLQLAAAHWRDVKQKTLYDEYKPLVNIPLVIAMWEPMARALGYPQAIGWQDISKVATNPKGWAAYGHPEWGQFRWGHAHPDANSGFLTILSEVYASLNKTEGITAADLKNPQVVSFLKEFEGAVEHYGLSNDWIDDLMHAKGPAYLSCAVQYENTIIESNTKHQNKPFKLVAIYPKEGNVWTQHPVAVLKEEWMTPEKEEAAKKFVEFLLSKKAQAKAMELGLRPILPDMEIAAPFDEEHGVQAKLQNIRKFAIPDESVLKRIRDIWEEVKIPATIVMVLDRSGSMKGEPIDQAKIGGVQFIQKMKARDQVQVIIFNSRITPLTEICTIRDCGEQTISRLQGVFADGGTALYDATAKAYKEMMALKKREPNRRYAILVLSDGMDTSSDMNQNDFLDLFPKGEDFDVPKIYTIAYGSEADKNLLAEISNRTNARLFSSSPEEIGKTYKELSANF